MSQETAEQPTTPRELLLREKERGFFLLDSTTRVTYSAFEHGFCQATGNRGTKAKGYLDIALLLLKKLEILEQAKEAYKARGQEGEKDLQQLKKALEFLAKSQEGITELSRASTERPRLFSSAIDPETYDIQPTSFESVWKQVKNLGGDKISPEKVKLEGLSGEKNLSEKKCLVDSGRIGQALIELLNNALESTARAQKGEVTVIFDTEEDKAVISVIDTGEGMSEELLTALLDQPYKLDKEKFPTEAFPGEGFGLPICRAITEQHKGKLTVRSKKGIGSIFTMCLPLEKSSS